MSASLETEQGQEILKVTIPTDNAAYSVGKKSLDFLASLMRKLPEAGPSKMRFIASENLVDRYGNESFAPTMQFDIDMADAKRINYKNITAFGLLNLAQNVTFLHPAAVRDVEEFCKSDSAKYVDEFCEASAESIAEAHR